MFVAYISPNVEIWSDVAKFPQVRSYMSISAPWLREMADANHHFFAVAFTIVSFCVLTGPPVAGRLLSAMDGQYLGPQALAGSLLMTGTVTIILSKRANMKSTSRGWVSKI